jgi:hypothetical protein
MPKYTSFDPNTELNGRTVSAFITNINHEDIASILSRHGLDAIDPNTWYPIQYVLNVLEDISEEANAMSNFVSIGVAATELALGVMPENLKTMSLDGFMQSYPQMYQSRLRGGDGGEVRIDKLDDLHYVIDTRFPFPDDVTYGVFFAYIRHYIGGKRHFALHYDDRTPRRDHGGERTIIHLNISPE